MTKMEILDSLVSRIQQVFVKEGVNDDVKMIIESYLSEHGCFPVENTLSYQHLDGQMYTENSKYVMLNQRKYYDDEDNEVTKPNLCFEFEEGEVYTVELRVIEDLETGDQHFYIEPHGPHVARFNEYHHDLKTKTSREFLTKTKSLHSTNAFSLKDYTINVKNRFGIKECLDGGILDTFPVMYAKSGSCVYLKMFTVVITKKGCYVLKY